MKVGHFQYSFNRFSSDFKHAYNACFLHNAVPPPVYGPNKYAPRFHHKLNSCFNGWCPNCSQRNAAPAPCVQIWCGTLKVHAHTCNVQKKKNCAFALLLFTLATNLHHVRNLACLSTPFCGNSS